MAPVPLSRNREFMLLWSGQAVSGLGSQVSLVAYPLLVLAVSGSAAKAGLVGFARNLPIALLALPAGVLADRVNRKRLMVACDAARAVALIWPWPSRCCSWSGARCCSASWWPLPS